MGEANYGYFSGFRHSSTFVPFKQRPSTQTACIDHRTWVVTTHALELILHEILDQEISMAIAVEAVARSLGLEELSRGLEVLG